MEEKFENDDFSRYAGPDFREHGYKRADERIYEEVCEALREDLSVDVSDIGVSVRDGIVFLEGFAHNRTQKRIAEVIAAEIPGVQDVRNQIRIA